MSGGHLDYFCFTLEDHAGDFGDIWNILDTKDAVKILHKELDEVDG